MSLVIVAAGPTFFAATVTQDRQSSKPPEPFHQCPQPHDRAGGRAGRVRWLGWSLYRRANPAFGRASFLLRYCRDHRQLRRCSRSRQCTARAELSARWRSPHDSWRQSILRAAALESAHASSTWVSLSCEHPVCSLFYGVCGRDSACFGSSADVGHRIPSARERFL